MATRNSDLPPAIGLDNLDNISNLHALYNLPFLSAQPSYSMHVKGLVVKHKAYRYLSLHNLFFYLNTIQLLGPLFAALQYNRSHQLVL